MFNLFKKKDEFIKVKDAVATIHLKNGQQTTLSFEADFVDNDVYPSSGLFRLITYLNSQKFFKDDNGIYYPVENISSFTIQKTEVNLKV